MGTTLSLSYDRADGTWEQTCRKVPEGLAIAAKMSPYIVVGFLQIGMALIAGKIIGGLPVYGSIALLIFTTLVFLLSLTFFAVLVARLTTPINSLRITMFMALPSMALSGFTWPLSGMHPVIRFLGECLPITWYADCFKVLTLKGAGWSGIVGQIGILVLMLVVLLAANILIGQRKGIGRFMLSTIPKEADTNC